MKRVIGVIMVSMLLIVPPVYAERQLSDIVMPGGDTIYIGNGTDTVQIGWKNIDMNNLPIKELAEPTGDSDAATKFYADNITGDTDIQVFDSGTLIGDFGKIDFNSNLTVTQVGDSVVIDASAGGVGSGDISSGTPFDADYVGIVTGSDTISTDTGLPYDSTGDTLGIADGTDTTIYVGDGSNLSGIGSGGGSGDVSSGTNFDTQGVPYVSGSDTIQTDAELTYDTNSNSLFTDSLDVADTIAVDSIFTPLMFLNDSNGGNVLIETQSGGDAVSQFGHNSSWDACIYAQGTSGGGGTLEERFCAIGGATLSGNRLLIDTDGNLEMNDGRIQSLNEPTADSEAATKNYVDNQVGSVSKADIDDDGSLVVSNADTINFSTDLSVADAGNNEVTVSSTASSGGAANEGYVDPEAFDLRPGDNRDHGVDVVNGGKIYVSEPNGDTNPTVVRLDAADTAFDITTSGTGGLINGSGAAANTWYECGVVADSEATNNPAMVCWTHTSSTDSTPTSSADLPTGYELFRSLGPTKTWWLRTDGSSNLRGFDHNAAALMSFTDTALENIGNVVDDGSPPTSATPLDVSGFVPPGKYTLWFNSIKIGTSGAAGFQVNATNQPSGQLDRADLVGIIDDGQVAFPGVMPEERDQTIFYRAGSNATNITIQSIVAFQAVSQ